MELDRISSLYNEKTLLVTGGTGFIGKTLIEKILRLSKPKRIYLLIRPKKGKHIGARLKDIFESPIFEKLKQLKGINVFESVTAVSGDLSGIELDLSPDDRMKLIDEVEMIYHSAATVRFNEPLKNAVILNTRSAKYMLELAHEMKRLILFVHVSTAYCHLDERVLYEKMYDPPADPRKIIETVEEKSVDEIEEISSALLGNAPNTYTFTKALAESLISDELDKLPIIVCRPSIVVPIWKGPLPGWTDNLNGVLGVLIGAGKGVIRTMYCQEDTYADFIPVDIAINGIMCASMDYMHYGERNIYNLTSSHEVKVTWKEIVDLGREVISERIPFNRILWYPGGSMKSSKFLHRIDLILFQLIPALIIDFLLLLLGKKPFLWKVQKRIIKGFELLEYFANNQWDFNNENLLMARSNCNLLESERYSLSSDGLDYRDYFTDCIRCARLYILKESDKSIPAAKRAMKIMYFIDLICKVSFFIGLLYVIFNVIF